MKYALIMLFCSLQIFCFSEKVIYGTVYKVTRIQDTSKLDKEYKIYLLKNENVNAKGKWKATLTDADFSIELSNTEIKKYSFLKFKYGSLFTIVPLTKNSMEGLKVYMQDKFIPKILIRKPAIYLYAEKETEVKIIHQFKGRILTTYPSYNDGWKVRVNPKGVLFNVQDNRQYNYLFWDGEYTFPTNHFNYQDGFYIDKKDYVSFLQEKLSYVGLNENEINDFIVYWLPELNRYNQVFIHFRINDNIGNSSELRITPNPDVLIRLFMEFKEYNPSNSMRLPLQNLPQFKRNKFVVIEWGGTEIGNNKLK